MIITPTIRYFLRKQLSTLVPLKTHANTSKAPSISTTLPTIACVRTSKERRVDKPLIRPSNLNKEGTIIANIEIVFKAIQQPIITPWILYFILSFANNAVTNNAAITT